MQQFAREGFVPDLEVKFPFEPYAEMHVKCSSRIEGVSATIPFSEAPSMNDLAQIILDVFPGIPFADIRISWVMNAVTDRLSMVLTSPLARESGELFNGMYS